MSPVHEPQFSLIVPCYNEQETIPYTIPPLVAAFEKAGVRLELILVDNGSKDRTGEVIDSFLARGMPVVKHRVELNEGYGWGVLQGFTRASADWIGVIPCDGQVDPEDVAKLFEAVRYTDGKVIGKVRRRFRMDGPLRKVVSIAYNCLVFALWPNMGSIDVNGSPKIVHREVLRRLDLRSRKWFLDPELMIKAHYLGARVIEVNVFARMRSHGLSHVRATTCWEFFAMLLRYRFGSEMRAWRRQVEPLPSAPLNVVESYEGLHAAR
ncbi:MAG: glycosyltransferase family 2 protein [Planctomycetes bacterium]|nr:glycosyltransferase family 2 protein [Planctomycetota bacterium]